MNNFQERMKRIQSMGPNNTIADRINAQWVNSATFIINIRGFFNWMASTLMMETVRNPNNVSSEVRKSIEIWYGIAKEAVGETDIINYPKVTVRYEELRDSQEARRDLCDKIGGTFSEEFVQYVPSGGGGSSFDGRSFQGKGLEMKTDERCLQVMASEYRGEYASLIKESEEVAVFYACNFKMASEEQQVFEEIFN
jgi:hypothetical protein